MPTTYSATLLESHMVGMSVNLNSPISATDQEMGHSIFYSISDSFDDGAFFSIDEVTGVLSLAHSLDVDHPNSRNNLMFTVGTWNLFIGMKFIQVSSYSGVGS